MDTYALIVSIPRLRPTVSDSSPQLNLQMELSTAGIIAETPRSLRPHAGRL